MKILSLIEIKIQNGQFVTDEEGNLVLDAYGHLQYTEGNSASKSVFDYEDSDATTLKRVSSKNKARALILESYAQKNGVNFDSQWGEYSYSEIIAMEENGVLIPQEILDWAHSMENSDPSAFLNETEEELNKDKIVSTEKEDSFVALKKRATKAIKNCDEKSDKTKKSLEDLNIMQAELERIQDEAEDSQLDSMAEMKKATKDWDKLQKKIKNNEILTQSEQSKLKELKKIFQKDNSVIEDNMKKNIRIMEDISVSLSEKNEFAVESKLSGDEAVEVADSLKDFNLNDDFIQTGFSRAFGASGILGLMIGVSMAKDLAQKTMQIGTETQVFSENTQLDLNAVAAIMDLEIAVGDTSITPEDLINESKDSIEDKKLTEVLTTLPSDSVTSEPSKEENSTEVNNSSKTTSSFLTSTSDTATTDATEVEKSAGTTSNTENSTTSDSTTKISKSKKEESQDPKQVQGTVDNIKSETNSAHKESAQINKDAKKTTTQLKAEAENLQKNMEKDAKLIQKLTKESLDAAKKQEEMIAEYEVLTSKNEQIAAKQNQNKLQTPKAQPQEQVLSQNEFQGENQSKAQITETGSENDVATFEQNSQRIDQLGNGFKKLNNKITRNSVKMKNLEKINNKRFKSFNKKSKTIDKRVKAEQKAEEVKAKKLQKQLGVVGVASNIFSITTSTGLAMIATGFGAAAGGILVNIGLYGTATCGVTKSAILIANDMLSQGLMSLATTTATVAMSLAGGSAAVEGVLGAVNAGSQIVSSSAELVNNVKTLQGKEASDVMTKLSTVAGAVSSVAGATNGLKDIASKNVAQKLGAIATATGTAMSTTGSLMAEFGNESSLTNVLAMVGSGISFAGSMTTLVSKNQTKVKDNDNTNQDSNDIMNNSNAGENNTTNNNTDNNLANNTSNKNGTNSSNQPLSTEVSPVEPAQSSTDIKEIKQINQEAQETGIADANLNEQNADVQASENTTETDTANDTISEAKASENTPKKDLQNKDLLSKALNITSTALNIAASIVGGKDTAEEDQKKIVKFHQLSREAKDIIKKHKQRVASLENMRNDSQKRS